MAAYMATRGNDCHCRHRHAPVVSAQRTTVRPRTRRRPNVARDESRSDPLSPAPARLRPTASTSPESSALACRLGAAARLSAVPAAVVQPDGDAPGHRGLPGRPAGPGEAADRVRGADRPARRGRARAVGGLYGGVLADRVDGRLLAVRTEIGMAITAALELTRVSCAPNFRGPTYRGGGPASWRPSPRPSTAGPVALAGMTGMQHLRKLFSRASVNVVQLDHGQCTDDVAEPNGNYYTDVVQLLAWKVPVGRGRSRLGVLHCAGSGGNRAATRFRVAAGGDGAARPDEAGQL